MKALLDTCIISHIYRAHRSERLKHFLHSIGEENCFISVVTLGEIINGIHQLDEGKKKKDLLVWGEQFESKYSDHLLPINSGVARVWGELTARTKRIGKNIPVADGLIAATALYNGLHVITENVKDFEPTGVQVINPYINVTNQ
ncbi:MAG: type II toxin-antitoxin system VapC family toxin [Candidatus Omnitrophica bacterium]|nr:type II toxin-antitoxin system VapC family toxin [Candidatus Omnitrophota bacterium]